MADSLLAQRAARAEALRQESLALRSGRAEAILEKVRERYFAAQRTREKQEAARDVELLARARENEAIEEALRGVCGGERTEVAGAAYMALVEALRGTDRGAGGDWSGGKQCAEEEPRKTGRRREAEPRREEEHRKRLERLKEREFLDRMARKEALEARLHGAALTKEALLATRAEAAARLAGRARHATEAANDTLSAPHAKVKQ